MAFSRGAGFQPVCIEADSQVENLRHGHWSETSSLRSLLLGGEETLTSRSVARRVSTHGLLTKKTMAREVGRYLPAR